MGTTRIKVIDLSSDQKEVKTSRKHAEKLAASANIKEEKPKAQKVAEPETEAVVKEEKKQEIQEQPSEGQVPEQEVAKSQDQEEIKEEKKVEKTAKASTSKATKKHKHHQGKKYKDASTLIDPKQTYPQKEAIELLRKTSYTKFDPSIEVHLNVSDKGIRGKVSFPHSIGAKKEKRFLVFSDKKIDAKNIISVDEKAIADIESGKLKPQKDFDVVITIPKYMPQLAKVAKILGPRGMMPNPKNGTITDDPKKQIESEDQGSHDFKTDPTALVIHTKIGKLSFKDEEISQNLKALVNAVGPQKIKKATITSTMGPGIKFDAASK